MSIILRIRQFVFFSIKFPVYLWVHDEVGKHGGTYV